MWSIRIWRYVPTLTITNDQVRLAAVYVVAGVRSFPNGDRAMKRYFCADPKTLSLTHRQEERKQIITPWLRYYAHITLFGIFKTLLTTSVVIGGLGFAGWRLFLLEQWVEDVEYEANVDANKALEDLEEDEAARKKSKKKGKEKAKSEADSILEEEGKK